VGLIWFSLADYFNALWAFQFAWYLILFFFVLMLYLLLRENVAQLFSGLRWSPRLPPRIPRSKVFSCGQWA